MDGKIDWSGIPVIAEMLGVDAEMMVRAIYEVRDSQRAKK